RHGRAIAIAHPHPESIAFLQQQINKLESEQVELRPISHYFQNNRPAVFASEVPESINLPRISQVIGNSLRDVYISLDQPFCNNTALLV
ncbi:MAG: hypothetical protein CL531_08455, partial [Aestuariibacter sp.]|nr:hypothetical protein [Aestuariibacter sp.]